MTPEDRLTELLRADAEAHRPADGREGIARRVQARRRARTIRRVTVPAVVAAVALAVVVPLVLAGGGPGQQVRTTAGPPASGPPATTGAGGATATTAGTTPPTTTPPTTTPPSTTVPSGAHVPSGWTLGGPVDQAGSVVAVATSPSSAPAGYPPTNETSVIVRFPVDGSEGATSARFPGGAAVAEGGAGLWAVTGTGDQAGTGSGSSTAGASAGVGPAPSLVELDPDSLAVLHSYSLDSTPSALVVGASSVWVGMASGELERTDPPTGLVTLRVPGSGLVTSLSLSPAGTFLYEMLNNPSLVQRDAATGALLHTVSLPGPGGDTVEATSSGVWAHFPTGMADEVEGFSASDLSSFAAVSGDQLGESAERLSDGLDGNALFVIGYQRAGCFRAGTGARLATFALPFTANSTPVVAGPDGLSGVTPSGLERVSVPAACSAP